MPRVAQPEEVKNFLISVKHTVIRPDGFDLVPRKDNLAALADLGLDRSFPRKVVLALSIRNYCFTDHDRDRPGEVWVFGTKIEGISFYIKLKLDCIGDRYIVKCLSFHPEREGREHLHFPYRE
ncbi:MAG: hypothetical protein KM312_05470 [Hydrogenibacillus schlegelii]|uniref:Toxin n=1 Tax=Hydrogenibacillus schlegelii TaxID=1484 RepID=A0A947D105_HYDSH|nr:hypothetical protein [Hydrogenibacillus schlegelii]